MCYYEKQMQESALVADVYDLTGKKKLENPLTIFYFQETL